MFDAMPWYSEILFLTAHEEGRQAKRAGVPFDACPYSERDWLERGAWEDGWFEADACDFFEWLLNDDDSPPPPTSIVIVAII